jgi:hypothetical protein
MRRPLPALPALALLLAACAPGAAAPIESVPVAAPLMMAQAHADLPGVPVDASVAEADVALPATPPASCPVTPEPAPSLDAANAPHDGVPYPGYFWYGPDGLWTELPQNGVWAGLPVDAHGYGNKLFFWHRDYDWNVEPEPPLTVTGRRLDAPADPLAVLPATNGFTEDVGMFMLAGGNFPTAGCWEVSASYHAARLTYVIWIAP